MNELAYDIIIALVFTEFIKYYGPEALIKLVNIYFSKYQQPAFLTWKSAPSALIILDKIEEISKEITTLLSNIIKIPTFDYIVGTTENPNNKWKVIMLQIHNNIITENIKSVPKLFETISLAQTWNAFISIYEPGCEIPFHNGQYKGLLTYTLAIEVPDDNKNCYLIIHQQKRNYKYSWVKHKGVLYDDNYLNTIVNKTNQRLVLLYINFKRILPFIDEIINKISLSLISVNQRTINVVNNANTMLV